MGSNAISGYQYLNQLVFGKFVSALKFCRRDTDEAMKSIN